MNRNPTLAHKALLRAHRIAIEQSLYMHLSMKPVRKRDLLGVVKMPEYGWYGLAPGNNRMPYWTLEGYRILRRLEHGVGGEQKPGLDLSSTA